MCDDFGHDFGNGLVMSLIMCLVVSAGNNVVDIVGGNFGNDVDTGFGDDLCLMMLVMIVVKFLFICV